MKLLKNIDQVNLTLCSDILSYDAAIFLVELYDGCCFIILFRLRFWLLWWRQIWDLSRFKESIPIFFARAQEAKVAEIQS